PPTIPAATLVTFRHGGDAGLPPELLMVVRSHDMRFAGGAAVFPGGRIDPADHELARRLATALDPEDAAARIGAIRETLEETGLAVGLAGALDGAAASEARAMLHECGELAPVLEAFDWHLRLDTLVPFARWIPRGLSHNRIFDTRFYLADLGTGAVDIQVDATENTHLFWTSAAAALERADAGEIKVIFPTRRNLERLAQFGSFAEARAHAQATPIVPITPQIVQRDGQRMLTIPADAGYPVVEEDIDSAMRG
ncbi:MAG: NUDIX domain-containing protein, partial [Sphingomonadales bacterium]|nr:NUDIX domain-containing protein [Sphingomonadales bacterium]